MDAKASQISCTAKDSRKAREKEVRREELQKCISETRSKPGQKVIVTARLYSKYFSNASEDVNSPVFF